MASAPWSILAGALIGGFLFALMVVANGLIGRPALEGNASRPPGEAYGTAAMSLTSVTATGPVSVSSSTNSPVTE